MKIVQAPLPPDSHGRSVVDLPATHLSGDALQLPTRRTVGVQGIACDVNLIGITYTQIWLKDAERVFSVVQGRAR